MDILDSKATKIALFQCGNQLFLKLKLIPWETYFILWMSLSKNFEGNITYDFTPYAKIHLCLACASTLCKLLKKSCGLSEQPSISCISMRYFEIRAFNYYDKLIPRFSLCSVILKDCVPPSCLGPNDTIGSIFWTKGEFDIVEYNPLNLPNWCLKDINR